MFSGIQRKKKRQSIGFLMQCTMLYFCVDDSVKHCQQIASSKVVKNITAHFTDKLKLTESQNHRITE